MSVERLERKPVGTHFGLLSGAGSGNNLFNNKYLLEDFELMGGAGKEIVEVGGCVHLLAVIQAPPPHHCLQGLLPLIVCALVIKHTSLQPRMPKPLPLEIVCARFVEHTSLQPCMPRSMHLALCQLLSVNM